MNRDFLEMLSALIAAEADFLIVGAYALAAHGVPRATGDLDIWVRADRRNADRVLGARKGNAHAGGLPPGSVGRAAPSLGRGVASGARRVPSPMRLMTTTVRSSSGGLPDVNSLTRSINARVISLTGRSRSARKAFLT